MSGGLVALTSILVVAAVVGAVALSVYWFRFRRRSHGGSGHLDGLYTGLVDSVSYVQ